MVYSAMQNGHAMLVWVPKQENNVRDFIASVTDWKTFGYGVFPDPSKRETLEAKENTSAVS